MIERGPSDHSYVAAVAVAGAAGLSCVAGHAAVDAKKGCGPVNGSAAEQP
jgi:hypothetical protein